MSDSTDEDDSQPFVVEYDDAGKPTNLPKYIYKRGKKFNAEFNRGGKTHQSEISTDIRKLLKWMKNKNEQLDAEDVPPAREYAERTPAAFTSEVDGVRYVNKYKKWTGSVYDRLLRKNIHTTNPSYFEVKTECEAAKTKLEADESERFEAEITRRIVANGLADLPRAPANTADAQEGTVYCNLDRHNVPYRALVAANKKQYKRACQSCHQEAVPNEKGGGTQTHCSQHGGGPRCQLVDFHVGDDVIPSAQWHQIVSADASLRIDESSILQPQYVGKRACMSCLRRVDPMNPIVKQQVRGEVLVVRLLMTILFKIPAVRTMLGKEEAEWIHDCTTGLSRRRPDLLLKVPLPDGRLLMILFENDERQHADRTTSCEHSKIAGHFIDFGAVGFTEKEGNAVDVDANELAAMKPAEREKIEASRKTAIQNIQRRIRAQERIADDAPCPNIHVIRFNPDAYLDPETNVVHKSLIVQKKLNTGPNPTTDDDPENMRKALSKDAEKELKKVAERIRQLVESAKDPEWIKTKKELEIEYFRYGEKTFSAEKAEKTKAAFKENGKKRKREAAVVVTTNDGGGASSSGSSSSGSSSADPAPTPTPASAPAPASSKTEKCFCYYDSDSD